MQKTSNSVVLTYEEMMKSRGWDRVIFTNKNNSNKEDTKDKFKDEKSGKF